MSVLVYTISVVIYFFYFALSSFRYFAPSWLGLSTNLFATNARSMTSYAQPNATSAYFSVLHYPPNHRYNWYCEIHDWFRTCYWPYPSFPGMHDPFHIGFRNHSFIPVDTRPLHLSSLQHVIIMTYMIQRNKTFEWIFCGQAESVGELCQLIHDLQMIPKCSCATMWI